MAALTAATVAVLVSPAHGTYLGENGKISFDVSVGDTSTIETMDPDGSNRVQIATNGGQSAWAPDGSRIAYACGVSPSGSFGPVNACTANPDGSAVDVLHNGNVPLHQRPFWSPDGLRLIIDDLHTVGHGGSIAFVGEVWRINSDDGSDEIRMAGTGSSGSWSPNGMIVYTDPDGYIGRVMANRPGQSVFLTETGSDFEPDWSPDGTKIVFISHRDGNGEIYVMNADGSNETRLTNTAGSESMPAWSPDGTKILYQRIVTDNFDLFLMNPDGTGQTQITNTPVSERNPAWQPVPQLQYARPKGATPVRMSLVPAYEPCVAPNRQHGPPLAFGSCAPPDERAGFMTFGSAPTGASPKAIGHVLLKAIPGTPDAGETADVEISVDLTDVRRGSDLADGPGSLEFPVPLRLTDKDSVGPFNPEQGTVQDFNYFNNPLRVLVPCAETADPAVGSTCSVNTSADALTPSAVVREGARAMWQLDQIAVYDGGEDGFIDSRDDNTVLAVQGVFVP